MQKSIVVVLSMVVGLLVVSPVYASTPTDDAIAALKDAPVYVSPDIEELSSNTPGKLMGQLNEDDNVVAVMLPAAAGDASTVAHAIDGATGNKRIVAVSVGDELAAVSSIMPSGVAADLMDRADSVSTSNVEALGTFIRNVHEWQRLNPQPVETPAPKQQPADESNGIIWILLALIGAVGAAVCCAIALTRSSKSRGIHKWDDFSSTPQDVRRKLQDIKSLREQVADHTMDELIKRVCRDTNQYYKRGSGPEGNDSTVANLLGNMTEVLRKYILIQDDVRQGLGYYYHPEDPQDLLRQGQRSVEDFAEYIRSSIQRGISLKLEDFTFNMEIVRASRSTD